MVKLYAPRLLRYRSSLLCDEKNEIKSFLDECIYQLEAYNELSDNENILRKNFLCIAKLYKVFCNDFGPIDMQDAYNIAKELDNQLLLAYVFKYAFFFENISLMSKIKCSNRHIKYLCKIIWLTMQFIVKTIC